MNLQYISDDKGKTTGVFIPIKEWNNLKRKYKELQVEINEIPDWHQEIVLQRLKEYNQHKGLTLDFEETMDNIEKTFDV